MGPLESLQRVEQDIQKAARQGVKRAKSRLREATTRARSSLGRTGIVSINGHDVERIRCIGGQKKPVG